MPLYEFECPICKQRFEELGSITNMPLGPSCPDCQVVTRKLVSLSSFRMAVPFTVVDSDGRVRHYQPDGGTKLPSVEDEAKELKKEYA